MLPSDATSLRVALVIHSLRGGGAERLMSQLASRWAQAGHSVHLITLALPCPEDYIVDAKVTRHSLGLVGKSATVLQGLLANRRRVKRLRQVLDEIRPEFMLSFCDQMNIVAATAARHLRIPRWLAEHSDPRRQQLGFLWEHWRNWAYPQATGLVVLTEPIAAHMQQRFPTLPLRVIPPAVPAQQISAQQISAQSASDEMAPPSASSARETDPPAQKILLALGRHSPEKNYGSLLRAWKILADRFPQWQLVLAGDGPDRPALQSLAAELELTARVGFPGWISEPRGMLADSGVFVLPSLYEGVPLALLEAMSLGRVCVCTPCCDSVMRWAEQGALVVTATAEPKDLAEALQRVLADPEACEPMRLAAVAASQAYSWSHVGALWDQLLLTTTSGAVRDTGHQPTKRDVG